jgi:hypothetical protein
VIDLRFFLGIRDKGNGDQAMDEPLIAGAVPAQIYLEVYAVSRRA